MRVRASSVPHLTNYLESGGVCVREWCFKHKHPYSQAHTWSAQNHRKCQIVRFWFFLWFFFFFSFMSIIEINFRLQCATFCSLEIESFATRTLKMLKKNVFHTENSIYMGVPIDVLNVNFSKIKSNSKYFLTNNWNHFEIIEILMQILLVVKTRYSFWI